MYPIFYIYICIVLYNYARQINDEMMSKVLRAQDFVSGEASDVKLQVIYF